ncbi:hypothetical protein L484_006714 [Morus notabilis]|uniref:Uncharacterized protein n=1 Tax=Morus notabilis TaxID=981085 RepID=W9R219_9ROSA|nr:hypothetical protein L484_006714 [Morus notabilis]
MAVLLSKRLVLVTFILICFFSATARGRSLKAVLNKEVNDKNQSHDQDQQKVAKAVQDVHDQDQQEVTEIANELLTMDYTPARKKPPIHN